MSTTTRKETIKEKPGILEFLTRYPVATSQSHYSCYNGFSNRYDKKHTQEAMKGNLAMSPTKHEVIDVESGEVTGKRFEPGTLQIQDIRSDLVPNSFEEAIALWESPIEVKSDWELITDKRQLIGKPFLIQKVRFYEGNFGPAVAVMAITQDNHRVVFNDGSSGILQELLSACEKYKRDGGFLVPNGLRMTEYEYEVRDFDGNLTGEKKPAKTFHLV